MPLEREHGHVPSPPTSSVASRARSGRPKHRGRRLLARRGFWAGLVMVVVAGSAVVVSQASAQQTLDLKKWYVLVNRNSGKVLDVNGASTADGARVIQWPWTGSTNQQWTIVANPDGSVRLRSVKSGKLLDSPAGSSQGAALDQWTDTNSNNQWWQLVPASTGYYRIVNVHTGWCVDVSGASTADGASVIQWPPNSGSNQEWQPIAV